MAYLRSIRLKGFKTFARTTEIVVEPGITVIIGPNGSGKSNIADAVLWALGEQSPTAIRGRSMQDVIFSGSDGRKGTAGAEVVLQFDNSSGAFPIEFDEVEISRSIARDGASTYRLNGAPVRLVDVQELISAVGLGREMHSVISQGKVEEFLTSTPLTRRSLVEEASGLGRYKKRRQRAQSKLEKVRANLERVLDVENEVRKALRPLKQQVTAAERFTTATEELAVARTRLLLAELGELVGEAAALGDRHGELQAARADAEAELEAIRGARAREEEEFARSMRRREELSARYHEARADTDRIVSRVASLEQRLSRLRGELERVRRRREMAEVELERADERLARVSAGPGGSPGRLGLVEEAVARLDEALATVRPQAQAADEGLERLREQVFELESGRSRLRRERELLERELEERAATDSQLAEQRRAAVARLEGADDAAGRLQAEREQAERRRDETEAARRSAVERAGQAEQELSQVVEAERAAREDLAELEARVRVLESLLARREGVPQAARRLLDSSPGARLLIEVLDVRAGYERAVAAVLGPLAHAVVLGGKRRDELLDDVEGAVEILWPEVGPGGAGAGVGASGGETRDEGEVEARSLWSVVDGPPDVLAALARMLPAELVGEETPGLGGSSGRAPAVPTVTVAGTVSLGEAHAGRRGEAGAEAMMSARTELAELEQARRSAGARRDALEGQVEAARGAAEAARRASDEQAEAAREAARGAAGLEDELALCLRRAQEARGDVSALDERLAREEELRRSLEEELAATGAALDAHAERLDAEREALRAAKTDAEELKVELGRLDQKRAQAGLLLVRLKERRRAHEEEQARAAEAREAAGRLCEALRAREAMLTEAVPGVEALLAVTRDLADELTGRIGDLGTAVDESRRSSDDFAESLKEHGRREAELQQQLGAAGERLVEVQVARAHLEDKLAERERGIEELRRKHAGPRSLSLEDVAGEDPAALAEEVERLERRRERIGPVNPLAEQEFRETQERAEFLAEQRSDLEASLGELRRIIDELDAHIEATFAEVFEKTRAHFEEMVQVLFPGGKGVLRLVDVDKIPDGAPEGEQPADEEPEEDAPRDVPAYARQGVLVEIKPPKKAPRSMSLLSGGEKALSAIAFLFSLFLASPSAFYILDEVEAALDDVNIGRFLSLVRRYQEHTQFIIITHQRRTMEIADTLYGVAMDEDGTSRVLSRRLREAVGEP